jgi:hypothetical protein
MMVRDAIRQQASIKIFNIALDDIGRATTAKIPKASIFQP